MGTVSFSPDADDQWAHILDRDTSLAKILDSLLDSIESGEEPGRRRGTRRFCTARVPGRDDLYAIVWELRDGDPHITYIGRSPEM